MNLEFNIYSYFLRPELKWESVLFNACLSLRQSAISTLLKIQGISQFYILGITKINKSTILIKEKHNYIANNLHLVENYFNTVSF